MTVNFSSDNCSASPPSQINERIEAMEKPCPELIRRRQRGGQPGNQNARTHGFYSKSATPEEQQKMSIAAEMEGLDEEIALLRAKISAATEDPSQSNFLLFAISLLSRLLRTREKLGYQKSKGLDQAVIDIMNTVSFPVAQSMKRILESEETAIPPDHECPASPKTNPNESPAGSENESF